MLQDQLIEEMKAAMKAGEKEKVNTIRLLISACKNEKIAKKRELKDEDVIIVLQKQAKQRKDSIKQYTAGGRDDLVAQEEMELKLIETYLPEMMSEEEIKKVAKAKMKQVGVSDKSGIGKLMGSVMGELKGKADGAVVKSVVEKLLS